MTLSVMYKCADIYALRSITYSRYHSQCNVVYKHSITLTLCYARVTNYGAISDAIKHEDKKKETVNIIYKKEVSTNDLTVLFIVLKTH